jgi:flagellar biogenesis protein FliO
MEIAFVLKVVWAFALVGLLLFGLTYIMRALSRGRLVAAADRKLVTVVESTCLAQNVTLHVVKVGESFYLVGGGSAGITKIDDIPADVAQCWLDEQRRNFNGQRAAVVRMISKFKTP